MIAELVVASTCYWNNPGAQPYRQYPFEPAVERALRNYDFPPEVRRELAWKIKNTFSDAVVDITKTSLSATGGTASNFRDMHFRNNALCSGEVIRNRWSENHRETALIYCSNSYCVAIPTVCGNISRIDYVPHIKSPKVVSFQDNPPKFWEGELDPLIQNVPEPNSLLLASLGIFGIAAICLPKNKHKKEK